MEKFEFVCPTHIYFEEDGVSRIGELLREHGFANVYLVMGGKSLKNNGTYDKIVSSLLRYEVSYREYGGIEANPDISDVRKIVKELKEEKPDCILAAGGGSVLDASKCAAHGYYYDGDPLDFNKHVAKPEKALPVVTILTLAASGSEMSDSCVISDRSTDFKLGFNSVTNYPYFSLMDPRLTLTVPPYQVGIGLADMFSHSFERLLSPSHDLEPCDDLALGILSSIVKVSKEVLSKPNSIEARRAMMICGSLAHNGITSYGKTKSMPIHAAEHLLSARYPSLAHGQGIALLMEEQIRLNGDVYKDKLLAMGKVVFGIDNPTLEEVREAFHSWILSLPIAHGFDELPFTIKEEDIKESRQVLIDKAPRR
ncbi:MAG: iron-containing alcohol dehydrogenase [Bacilli bacterium]|nr:iron-containing alcohol dehydrogenase [Bacilli bacterium]